MRILALGGAGEMGRVAVRALVDDDRVDQVVVTDLDQRQAVRVAHALGPKVSGLGLNVADRGELLAAIRDCTVVVNTVGPYFRFGVPILSAAIEAGRDYVDICDDWEPTLDMLAMNDRARAAGVTALVGMGASPGIANLLAVTAARELDTVETIITGWNIQAAQHDPSPSNAPSAAIVHGIRQISGAIRVTRSGVLVDRPALERIEFEYPGIGAACGRSFGHPEAVTLNSVYPDLQNNTNIVVGDRFTLAGLSAVRFCVDHRILSPTQAARVVASAERMLPANPANLLKPGGLPPLFAVATGTHGNAPATAATALAQIPGLTMAENTGIPLAAATLLLASIRRPGVHTPETLIDPDTFFATLAPHCIGNPAPTAMTSTTRSWSTPRANADSLATSVLTAFLTPNPNRPPAESQCGSCW
ncbi:saccharopine dehydrogenase family protein [Nocardia altamirensis]|uniref:saccharopine dehydrogenase family protein n=1 Tax=Nocardia altamirensis TaxID=472158 RepID=UPI000840823B|nr:saccharopine dehydrogenase NADP-binding domain-containing protein [Nocardia altamirensis]